MCFYSLQFILGQFLFLFVVIVMIVAIISMIVVFDLLFDCIAFSVSIVLVVACKKRRLII